MTKMSTENASNFMQNMWPHLLELRKRLMLSTVIFIFFFAICYYFAPQIYIFLLAPYQQAVINLPDKKLIFTGLTEAFFTYMKLAFWAAFCISLPLILTQIWLFIHPGLYDKEKKAILPYLIFSPLLFLIGGAFVYYLIFPMAWPFFISFEMPQAVDGALPLILEARISEYLSLVMSLIFAFGLSFQLPLILILLVKVGFVKVDTLKKGRKYAIVIIFAASAILTPPDVISQIALAIPLMLLYEISLQLAKKIPPSDTEEGS